MRSCCYDCRRILLASWQFLPLSNTIFFCLVWRTNTYGNYTTISHGCVHLFSHLPKYSTTSDVVNHVVDFRNNLHHQSIIEIQQELKEEMALWERFELSSARHTGCLLKAGIANISNPAPYQARIPQLERVRKQFFS
jgi:hypothetical protein